MCSDLSKDEDHCSQAMEQFFKETFESGTSYYGQINYVAYSNASKRDYSFQGAVYRIMPDYGRENFFQGLRKLTATFLKNVLE